MARRVPDSDLRDTREAFSGEVALMYNFSKSSSFSDKDRIGRVGKEGLPGRGSNRNRHSAMR